MIPEENRVFIKHPTGGGAAAQAGLDFQNRIAAWASALILAEQNATLAFDLPANVILKFVRCETEQPIDDIMLGTSDSGFIFIQAKHSVNLSTRNDSDLASTIKQFIRQFIANKTGRMERPWERPLNQENDRLVLAVGSRSSLSIREHLKTVLNRLRKQVTGQTIEDAAKNQDENQALIVVKNHILHIWDEEYKEQPTDDVVRKLLSLIWVITFDVDPGGSKETEAKNLLRTAVLRNPVEADTAWNVLIQACANFVRNQTGGDRNSLQKILLNAVIDLKAPPSYLNDIQKLRQYTTDTVEQLGDLSIISVGNSVIKINRGSTIALKSVIEKQSIVVVGEPGAGKSGALHDLARELQSGQADVIFIAVDRIEAQSIGTIRNEIGIFHNLDEIMENWPGLKPAFLVIDALDAARSETAIKTFRDLISKIIKLNNRWRIVASIRKFDLRYNKQLQDLFIGSPPTGYTDTEFKNIYHINIPRLDDGEIKQVKEQSSDLADLIYKANPALSELLRNPFNLRLMSQLIGLRIPIDELSIISKQNELLDRYWIERIIRTDSFGDAREAILKKISQTMVSKRSLKINRLELDIADSSTSLILNDLLSIQIVTEYQTTTDEIPDRYTLTFSHHVLYDYAISRLILRVPDEDFINILIRDKELFLSIRPSLVFHFKHVWLKNPSRQPFWELVLRIIYNAEIPEIGKLIGPSVVPELAKRINDFSPLFVLLEEDDVNKVCGVEKAFTHVIGALLSIPEKSYDSLVGDGSGPWAEFVEYLSENMKQSMAVIICPLIRTLCDRSQKFTESQCGLIGKAARRLLAFAWESTKHNNWIITIAIQAVCRTYSSNKKESGELIRRCIEKEHMKLHFAEELHCLVREIGSLAEMDITLVEDIYKAIFTFNETSEEKTQIGGSRIIAMTSTRKQDKEMLNFALADQFSRFLEIGPINAFRVLIVALSDYVNEEHHPSTESETFEFYGIPAQIRSDYSHIWDDGNTYYHDEPLKMLDEVEKYLISGAQKEGFISLLRDIIMVVASENSFAVLWKRLLQCGIKEPSIIGLELKSLAWTKAILECDDTTIAAGNFITAIYEFLSEKERGFIEKSIVTLTKDVPNNELKYREIERNRLLGCIPEQLIISQSVRLILDELKKNDSIPPNEPKFKMTSISGQPYGEEEYLADKGVPVEKEGNKSIRTIEQPIYEFSREFLNASPSMEAIQAIFPNIKQLHEVLSIANTNDVHQLQLDYAWGTLAEACARIASSKQLADNLDIAGFTKAVLLQAATNPDPIHEPKNDKHFDESPSWGSPAPRIDAARGLMLLACYPTCVDKKLKKTIISLSKDKVPAVRYQIDTHLVTLYNTAPAAMWDIIEDACENEQSKGVLNGLLSGTLYNIAGGNADRVSKLVGKIFSRIIDGPGADSVRQTCVIIFLKLYLWQDNDFCRNIITKMIENLGDYLKEIRSLVVHTRELLTLGLVNPSNSEQDAVRKRAFIIVEKSLGAALNKFNSIKESKFKAEIELSQDEEEEYKLLAQLIDTIGTDIYFASGAYDESLKKDEQNRKVLSADVKERFLLEADNLLNCLSRFGVFPSTTHYLLETFEAYIPVNPVEIFMRIGVLLTSSQEGGYQYESLAADLFVKIIERYFAEYSWVFREKKECQRTLFEILDIFVNAGWPSARRLTYRLEEIYR
ncbi:hypothetical protein CLHUN_37860 [Ruminiclostridium hungatei]|uniref:Uncharacterized protein n=1 Tax=Ruminiclostridium hungatei TaxID=48256 RepID=A0A1V4SGG9_RUMHU|nr:ATP-binding protein [Ruminiclostridium hungatei]OPX42367.1 hypothetical protein CLHUN_37860 [Ruminiclostridium hungatei]